jgi:hypothetical protein
MACGVRTIENVAEVIHRGLTFDCEGMALASGGVAASNAMPLGRRDAKLCRAQRGHRVCTGPVDLAFGDQRAEQPLVAEQVQVAHVVLTNTGLSSMSHLAGFVWVVE